MAKENEMMSAMKIEDIRSMERFMFWLERVAILTQLLVYPAHTYLLSSTALLLLVTNTVYLYLSVQRQFIRPFLFEPEAIFYIERPAILLVILHYFVPRGCVYWAVIGLIVLILTNYVMINRYYNNRVRDLQKQLLKKNSLSSTLNTKNETRKGDDDKEKKKEKEKDIIKDDQSMKKKVEFNREWLFDYLSHSGSSSNGEKEEALPMNSIPPFETNLKGVLNYSLFAMEPSKGGKLKKLEEAVVEEGGLKEKSEVKANTRNSVQSPTSFTKYIKEEVACHGAEDGPHHELQENNKNTNAREDSKTEEDEQSSDEFKNIEDDLKDVKVECNDRVKREDDEVLQENSKNSSAASKELKIEEDDQKEVIAMADEVKEAKDEAEDAEVQNILGGKSGAAILSSHQKETDELEEAKHKEEAESTSNYNSDESSWEEWKNNLSRNSISSCEFLQEQFHDYEENSLEWELEKKDLAEKLEVGTKFWKRYEESCYKLQEEVKVEDSKTNELLQERRKFKEHESKWGMENRNLNAKLDAATKTLEEYQVMEKEFAEERLKWNEEKEHLQTKLDVVTESLEQERIKSKEKKDLSKMLDVATQSLENYMAIEKGFAEERKKWDEQKNVLNATISHADENVQYCQTLVNNYAEQCRQLAVQLIENHSWYQHSLDELTTKKDDLSSKLAAATSTAESYKVLYCQSYEKCEYYKACFEEYEEKCCKLKEDHLNLFLKLYTKSTLAESYKIQEVEDKCRRLEEEKTDLTAKLCAAKASSELYRACLHDFVA